MEPTIIDISRTIGESTAVWPGDTPFSRRWVMAIPGGCSCNTSTITLSAHTGAHTDAPSHFLHGAPSIDQVSLRKYMGPCIVIRTKDRECVRPSDFEGVDLRSAERVLFRTPAAPATDAWDDRFTYLSIEAARALAEAGVELVGIDTPSVDAMDSKTLDAHKILFEGGVAILESIDLSGVEPGPYQLIALPLRIAGGDSSPVRAVLLR